MHPARYLLILIAVLSQAGKERKGKKMLPRTFKSFPAPVSSALALARAAKITRENPSRTFNSSSLTLFPVLWPQSPARVTKTSKFTTHLQVLLHDAVASTSALLPSQNDSPIRASKTTKNFRHAPSVARPCHIFQRFDPYSRPGRHRQSVFSVLSPQSMSKIPSRTFVLFHAFFEECRNSPSTFSFLPSGI